jgi:hypothetical protein
LLYIMKRSDRPARCTRFWRVPSAILGSCCRHPWRRPRQPAGLLSFAGNLPSTRLLFAGHYALASPMRGSFASRRYDPWALRRRFRLPSAIGARARQHKPRNRTPIVPRRADPLLKAVGSAGKRAAIRPGKRTFVDFSVRPRPAGRHIHPKQSFMRLIDPSRSEGYRGRRKVGGVPGRRATSRTQ